MAIAVSPDVKRSTDTGWAVAPILHFDPVSALRHEFVRSPFELFQKRCRFFPMITEVACKKCWTFMLFFSEL